MLLLGGSTAFGLTATEEEKTIAVQLERELNEGLLTEVNEHWEVINLAVPNFISYQELVTLIRYGMKYNPDYVISLTGINDAIHYLITLEPNESSTMGSVRVAYEAYFGSPLRRIAAMLETFFISFKILNHIINRSKGEKEEELSPYIYTIW